MDLRWIEEATYANVTFQASQITVQPDYVEYNFSNIGLAAPQYVSGSIIPHPGGINNGEVAITDNSKLMLVLNARKYYNFYLHI